MKTAILFTGGSIRGAFQSGIMSHLRPSKPEHIRGISVGSLNASFLVDTYGKTGDWNTAIDRLAKLWLTKVNRPKNLIKSRGKISNAWNLLTDNFKGFFSNKPLAKLISKEIDFDNLASVKDILLQIGATNLNNGKLEFVTQIDKDFKKYMLASSAIPLLFPFEKISENYYYDGGIRDVMPVENTILYDIDEILIISTHPKRYENKPLNPKSIEDLSLRLMDLIVRETVEMDLFYLQKKFPKISIKMVQPELPIELDINNFDSSDILNLHQYGKYCAKHHLQKIQ